MSEKGSKLKRKGDPLRIPTAEEEPTIFSLRDLLGFLPIINIIIVIFFILLISNFFIDLVLFFMLVLTIAFFFSMFIEVWEQKQNDQIKNSFLIYNPMNISPLILFIGQFFYGFFFLSFIYLGLIEVLSIVNIFIWVYFGFSTLFLILVFRNSLVYVKEAVKKKEELKKIIMKDLNKHKKTENYAAQGYYFHMLIRVIEAPLIKAGFLSKLITFITILITFIPFIIPV